MFKLLRRSLGTSIWVVAGLLFLTVSCQLLPADGQFDCQEDDDCPPGWKCRESRPSEPKRCFESRDLMPDSEDTTDSTDVRNGTDSETETAEELPSDSETGSDTESDLDAGTDEDMETDTAPEEETDTGSEEETDTAPEEETDTGSEEETDTASEEETDERPLCPEEPDVIACRNGVACEKTGREQPDYRCAESHKVCCLLDD